jgi:hypothetical protein
VNKNMSAPPVPPAPPANVQAAANNVDNMTQQVYVQMARDPFFGPLVKAIPPPPKVSALFNGTFMQQFQNGVRQVAPQYPIVVPKEASERPTAPVGQGQTAIVV